MSNARYLNHNASFTDFAYRTLLKANDYQKASLNEFELKIFKDHSTIMKFCKHSTHDKLKLILTKMGYRWLEIWSTDEEYIEFALGSTVDQNDIDEKRVDAINSIAEKSMWINSDREFTLGYLLAQNANTDIYSRSATTKEITELARKYNKRLQATIDDEVAESKAAYDYLNKLLLMQLNSLEWAKDALDLEQTELRILCALFDKKNSALTAEEINTQLKYKFVKLTPYMKHVIEGLVERKLVLEDKSESKKTYAKKTFYIITSLGIKKMIEYRHFVHKMAFEK